ncbi:MAG: MFS transporter [Clostridia bacterium]|nr:MFS transporter [Clostridia bacterium]
MKLNYKRTILIGFAFFSICAFWQMYDPTIQLMLKDTFGFSDTVIGVVMALDNILALFMLPFFGTLSDKTHTRLGRRMPYILGGTALAVVFTLLIPVANGTGSAVFFMVVLGGALVAMSTYRSPAVALMPDLTPKPLRSKANAMINLMGTAGGLVVLVLIKILKPSGTGNYFPLYISVAAIMVVSVAILFITIKENKMAKEVAVYDVDETPQETGKGEKLPPEVKRSLVFILISIVMWFFAYNAVTSAFSRYTREVWGDTTDSYSTYLMVATVAATLSYFPIGIISSKLGRKKVIIGGVILMAVSYAVAFLFTSVTPVAFVIFALVGIGWASINVNSYPMVVEMSRGSDIGKYTGIYYACSMSAQILTPIISGALFDITGSYRILFPYAAVFSVIAIITMLFVKHGDSKPEVREVVESYEK